LLILKSDRELAPRFGFVKTAERPIPYDQWQVSNNGGTVIVGGVSVPAGLLPYYSLHGIGFQSNFILPKKDFVLFFKYYDQRVSRQARLPDHAATNAAPALRIPGYYVQCSSTAIPTSVTATTNKHTLAPL
jgi:hypothetical protein